MLLYSGRKSFHGHKATTVFQFKDSLLLKVTATSNQGLGEVQRSPIVIIAVLWLGGVRYELFFCV